MEPKFSWGTTLENKWKDWAWIYNAWVWLTTSFEIIKKLAWDIFIWTKDCLFSYNWEIRKEYFELIQTWKWTFVVFNIYTDRDIEVDFDDIRTKYMSFGSKCLKNQDFDNNIDFW